MSNCGFWPPKFFLNFLQTSNHKFFLLCIFFPHKKSILSFFNTIFGVSIFNSDFLTSLKILWWKCKWVMKWTYEQKNVNQEMFSHQGNTNQFSNSKKGVVDNWLHIPYQFQTSLSMIHHKRGSKQVLAKVFTHQHFKVYFESFWTFFEV